MPKNLTHLVSLGDQFEHDPESQESKVYIEISNPTLVMPDPVAISHNGRAGVSVHGLLHCLLARPKIIESFDLDSQDIIIGLILESGYHDLEMKRYFDRANNHGGVEIDVLDLELGRVGTSQGFRMITLKSDQPMLDRGWDDSNGDASTLTIPAIVFIEALLNGDYDDCTFTDNAQIALGYVFLMGAGFKGFPLEQPNILRPL